MPVSGSASLRTGIILAFLIFGLSVRLSAAASCLQSSGKAWLNTPITAQTAKFTATFDATASQADMDGVIGFSPSPASDYTGLAVIVRFSPAGTMDVRNGGNYAADVSLPYVAGASYRVRMVIDPVAKTYSVYVTAPGAAEVAVASNYAFRSEQSGASSFSYWATYSEIGTVSVCNMTTAIWSLAPTITQQPASQTVIAGSTATFSVAASGSAPITYQWKRNGSAIAGAVSASSYTTPATTSSDNGAQFTVVVSNSAGRVTSSAATLKVNSPASCVTSSTSWANWAVATQTAQFTATFDATPSQTDMDGVVGFSSSAAKDYASLAAIVRFSSAGTVDVRNGGGYSADVSLPYVAGASYHVRMVIDPVTKTYRVYVTAPGAAEVALASNYAFRSGQASASSLSNWTIYSQVGTVSVCSMSVTASSGTSGGTPDISWTPSSLPFGNVTVGASKSMAVTLTSSGSASTTISNVSISGAGFTASGVPAGSILSPGQTATLNVVFAPSGTGSAAGSAMITSNASNSHTTTISLSGSGVQVTSHSATLAWTASTSSVAGYNIYRATSSKGPYTKQNASLLGVMTYGDTSVAAGQTYYYMVTAVNSSNMESAYSNEVSAAIP